MGELYPQSISSLRVIVGSTRRCTIPGNAPLLNPVFPGVFSGVSTLNRNFNKEFEQIYYFIIYLNQYIFDLDNS